MSGAAQTGLRYLPGVVTLELDRARCNGCGVCLQVCPHGVLVRDKPAVAIRDRDACMECGACVVNCEPGALCVTPGVGCAWAILRGWLRRSEPTCSC